MITATSRCATVAVAVAATMLSASRLSARPVELGVVDWIRTYDEGVAEAKKSGKPMLLLFQEVPG